MAEFKFFNNGQLPGRPLHNGVTDQYLIELSELIWTYSDWVYTTMLSIDDDNGQDILLFEFTDIDQRSYWCKIYQNLSFEIMFLDDTVTGGEYLEELDFSDDVLNDHTRILDYLKNMPKTVKSSL